MYTKEADCFSFQPRFGYGTLILMGERQHHGKGLYPKLSANLNSINLLNQKLLFTQLYSKNNILDTALFSTSCAYTTDVFILVLFSGKSVLIQSDFYDSFALNFVYMYYETDYVKCFTEK